jgi:alkaline phosphatase D
MRISRRSFLKAAAAIGASLAWVGPARGSRVHWHERRDLYPQGVASGDPDRTASSSGRGVRLPRHTRSS